jgi:anoctamin-10/anoctamin-7
MIKSLLIAIQIQICNSIYSDVALKLNNYENHRTDTEYEDALITKTFLFEFVNSFISLFYTAFVKPQLLLTDPCTNGDCLSELQTTLGIIFMTRIFVGNFTEVVVPAAVGLLKVREIEGMISKQENITAEESKKEISEIERTFILPEYDVMLGTFADYSELVIQFGYATMFVAAFPLATVFSFINNYVEIRVDSWKLCQLTRRARPTSAEDIGAWYVLLFKNI